MMTNRRTFLHRASLLSVAAASRGIALGQNGLPKPPVIASKSCIVVDAVTGQSLFEKAADDRRPVASTQKLLSALVAVDNVDLSKTGTVEVEETKVEPHKLF